MHLAFKSRMAALVQVEDGCSGVCAERERIITKTIPAINTKVMTPTIGKLNANAAVSDSRVLPIVPSAAQKVNSRA